MYPNLYIWHDAIAIYVYQRKMHLKQCSNSVWALSVQGLKFWTYLCPSYLLWSDEPNILQAHQEVCIGIS